MIVLFMPTVAGLVPFLDGGNGMPKLYDGWFNDQISKQAATAVSKAIAAGKTKIEVNFPPVPNVDGKMMIHLIGCSHGHGRYEMSVSIFFCVVTQSFVDMFLLQR